MSNRQALANLNSAIKGASHGFNPYPSRMHEPSATNLSRYMAPIQFERIAHDIRMWRDVIREYELAWYPMRVKGQRMYMDTVENPYVKSVIERQKELTMQRDGIITMPNKGGKRVKSLYLSEQLNEQDWFEDYVDGYLNARLYGYSLIELGAIVGDAFPLIKETNRENIRPDGLDGTGPILTSMVYGIDGVHFADEKLISLCNHWVPTKPTRSTTTCGYGLLYNIALLEIHLRHVLEWNLDYGENYGMPIKVGKTNKIGKDRDEFENFLRNSASNAYVLLDKRTDDELAYVMAEAAGSAWKVYENIEERMQGVVAQLMLGHTDAMKSTPGKLGGLQNANKSGNNISLVQQAMNAKQVMIGNFVCRGINNIGAPKFRALGKYVGSKTIAGLFPEGARYKLLNDTEETETRRKKREDQQSLAVIAKTFNDGGYDVDVKQMQKMTGLKLTKQDPRHLVEQTRVNKNYDMTDEGKK